MIVVVQNKIINLGQFQAIKTLDPDEDPDQQTDCYAILCIAPRDEENFYLDFDDKKSRDQTWNLLKKAVSDYYEPIIKKENLL